MKGKLLWLAASVTLALSLVLTACATAPPEQTEVTPKQTETLEVPKLETAPKEAVVSSAEKPKYGGVLVMGGDANFFIERFDQVYAGTDWGLPRNVSNEYLLAGDWTRGQAEGGTKELLFWGGGFAPQEIAQHTGHLAKSWEIPDDQTLIFKIRQGVHFHDKPPVNGREMDAEDVARSIQHIYLNTKVPEPYAVLGAPSKVLSATATDKWTVVVKVEGLAQAHLEELGSQNVLIMPRESLDKYGDMSDWRNSLGTGPFMLTDFVVASSLRMARHPNYWKANPIGPGKGNQLPYLDGIKALVIPDASTEIAALRTAKIDWLSPVSWEDRDDLIRTNPQIKAQRAAVGTPVNIIQIKIDGDSPLAAPMKSQRVRQALPMAIDFQSIIDDFYGGNSVWEFTPGAMSRYYTKPEDMPEILVRVHGFKPEEAEIVAKMYTYHPDEAKKMLAEAGYPNGFKTKVVIEGDPKIIDIYSVIKDYWRKNLNVDLELDVKTRSVYQSLGRTRAFDAMIYVGGVLRTNPEKWRIFAPARMDGPRHATNYNDFKNPVVNAAMQRAFDNYGNIELRSQILKETVPYILWLGYHIPVLRAYEYTAWQPWLKNYQGEGEIGYRNSHGWVRYAWYDQDLKKKMGY